jgi:hypothetical protein
MGFALGLHGLKPGFAWFQTQDKPSKNRVYFLTTLNQLARRSDDRLQTTKAASATALSSIAQDQYYLDIRHFNRTPEYQYNIRGMG